MKCKQRCPECGGSEWWEYTEYGSENWTVSRLHWVILDLSDRHEQPGPWVTWWECQQCGLVVT